MKKSIVICASDIIHKIKWDNPRGYIVHDQMMDWFGDTRLKFVNLKGGSNWFDLPVEVRQILLKTMAGTTENFGIYY